MNTIDNNDRQKHRERVGERDREIYRENKKYMGRRKRDRMRQIERDTDR